MSRYALALLIWTTLQSPTTEFVAATLSRAEALYYDARFQETIQLLLPLDTSLRSDPGRIKDRIDVKLRIGLAHVGLGQIAQAKNRFAEICALDPDYSLDPKKFAPKIVSAFDEAKAEYTKVECQMFCAETDRLLEAEDAEALLSLIQSARSRCTCLEAAALDAATHFYELGIDAYKKEDFTAALRLFRQALRFNPEHDLSLSYIELTRNRLALAAERLFLEWRTQLEAHEFGLAMATYRKLQSEDIEGSATEALGKIRDGYRSQVSPLVNSWKQACSRGDASAMARLRRQAEEVLADPAIGTDLLAEMQTCSRSGCIQLPTDAALSRARVRSDAKLPAGIGPRPVPQNFALTVQVKVRIDEKGNVNVADPQSIQPNIRDSVVAAASRWKFAPVPSSENGCVETTIPISFRP
jgi:tetratricopeptide (TPR) repeat protein